MDKTDLNSGTKLGVPAIFKFSYLADLDYFLEMLGLKNRIGTMPSQLSSYRVIFSINRVGHNLKF
jgi:hypothetical protein